MKSPVSALFVGARPTGAWQIRAQQVASCRGNWHAATTLDRLGEVDVVVVVKWYDPAWAGKLAGRPVVFDVLDFWRQPEESWYCGDEAGAQALFDRHIRMRPAAAHIFATAAMAGIFAPLVGQHRVIYHHHRPGLARGPLRERPPVVAYEGDGRYLGEWRTAIEALCRELGMTFAVNPAGGLAAADIGVACRGRAWRGLLETACKSNVKLANLYGAGMPCVLWPEAGYRETAVDDVRFFRSIGALGDHLAALADVATRRRIAERFVAASAAYSVQRIAEQYESFLMEVAR